MKARGIILIIIVILCCCGFVISKENAVTINYDISNGYDCEYSSYDENIISIMERGYDNSKTYTIVPVSKGTTNVTFICSYNGIINDDYIKETYTIIVDNELNISMMKGR